MRIKLLFVFSVDEKHLVLPKFWAMECYGWVAKLKKFKKQMELSLSLIHPPNVENTKNYLHCKPWTFPTNVYLFFYTNVYHFYHFLPIFTDCFTNVYHFLPIFTDRFTNVYHSYHFLPILIDCFTNIYHFLPIFTKYRGLHGIIIFQLIKQYH